MKYDVFVSYSSKDEKIASSLVDRLESGGLTTFIAPRDLIPGESFFEQIPKAIDNSTNYLVLLTESGNESR